MWPWPLHLLSTARPLLHNYCPVPPLAHDLRYRCTQSSIATTDGPAPLRTRLPSNSSWDVPTLAASSSTARLGIVGPALAQAVDVNMTKFRVWKGRLLSYERSYPAPDHPPALPITYFVPFTQVSPYIS
ncbi:hypothetical protein RSOLAG1IB_12613 [Rhizoctonia solani AG-1 IB]|uniref:Uncharacterized protein n=1 Tax=Thanatephorus cucumeris (strain AG1-IB / isolate 7/3/14) TaxID=1108050 RepID=A0A0B7G1J2_THACB|nr:hypothetical protein RSOLAG1IB_12613 [Rhizoctonia solani AG-1 IB]